MAKQEIVVKNNASVYAKRYNGSLFLYARIELNNGKVVNVPLKVKSGNKKLVYYVLCNLERKENGDR